MQRLVFLIDGVVILLFLWFVFNVIHAMFHREIKMDKLIKKLIIGGSGFYNRFDCIF